jgi:nitrite reductase/ring-hydroxylating ferredoxin subunit
LTNSHDRRSFLGALASFFLALPLLGPALLALVSFLSPAPRRGGGEIPLLPLDQIPQDHPKRVRLQYVRRVGPYREEVEKVIYLRRTGDQVLALSSECTHLGCPVRYQEDTKQFACPCHGGIFDLEGRRLEGPPPRPLSRYTILPPAKKGAPVRLKLETQA